jgi:hypothetical protein
MFALLVSAGFTGPTASLRLSLVLSSWVAFCIELYDFAASKPAEANGSTSSLLGFGAKNDSANRHTFVVILSGCFRLEFPCITDAGGNQAAEQWDRGLSREVRKTPIIGAVLG